MRVARESNPPPRLCRRSERLARNIDRVVTAVSIFAGSIGKGRTNSMLHGSDWIETERRSNADSSTLHALFCTILSHLASQSGRTDNPKNKGALYGYFKCQMLPHQGAPLWKTCHFWPDGDAQKSTISCKDGRGRKNEVIVQCSKEFRVERAIARQNRWKCECFLAFSKKTHTLTQSGW